MFMLTAATLTYRQFSVYRGLGARVDWSKFPSIDEKDLQENIVKGGGPGGQAVNKTNNAVFLKHIPSGVWVKCHETRSLTNNQKIARKLLRHKLDNSLNGENSVEAQQKRINAAKRERSKERTREKYAKRREEKAAEKSGHADQIPPDSDQLDTENDDSPVDKELQHNNPPRAPPPAATVHD